ncbi:MAG: hypothetical protein P0Y59_08660 [Candidatus Sphingomonas phytovorans]|nr:hypothetical protein [Sphingomonas sp.]WEK01728.1 MAG: hypothetical protein P0Y59_08660 [Sphingomonas sp.]
MFDVQRIARRMVAGLLLAAALGTAAPARAPQLAVLAHIETGQWQLREAGSTAPARSLCVSDPAVLLQVGHVGVQCSRFVIDDTPESATVHYTCPGSGHGRTTLSLETPRLLHLQTQGIAGGAPFDLDYEARRTGACTPRGPGH